MLLRHMSQLCDPSVTLASTDQSLQMSPSDPKNPPAAGPPWRSVVTAI